MNPLAVFNNHVLVPALTAWGLAQLIKLPLEFIRTRKWNWRIVFSTGGMPSSHSALVAGTAYSLGLNLGFDSPLFAVAVAVAMVVVYDAAGIRRQAGRHARIINAIIDDLSSGHPLKEEQLREMLGHTPLQVGGGVILGFVTSHLFWLFWK